MPRSAGPEPVAADEATVTPGGAARIEVGCAATATSCAATVTLFVDGQRVTTTREGIEAGSTSQVLLDLPLRLQRELARNGTIEARLVTVIEIDGSTIRVESIITLEAPPADVLARAAVKPAADGSSTITARCEGATVSRCDGVVTLYATATSLRVPAGRAAAPSVVGTGRLAGPAGGSVRARVVLTPAARALLRRVGTLEVQPVVTFKGGTRLERELPSYRITMMDERTWLRRALATLRVGGQPRLDLNLLLDDVRGRKVGRRVAAARIEREIIPARQRARARAEALPTPPARLQPTATLLLRAFDQSLAANHAYVEWLRSGAARDDRGWRASQRATRTKAELMRQLATHGTRHGIRVPPPTSLWP
jgi:hypothetical protein